MLTPLRNLTYRKLFSAQVVALLGTGLATVALGLIAYSLDPRNAAGVLGTALTVKMVAYVFVAPLATAALAKVSRTKVLITADLIRMAVAATLPFITESWQIYPLIFLLQAASATFTPTFQSVIPEVLPDEAEYTKALSLSRLAYDLEAVVSPMFAALLLLVVSPRQLYFGTALGFAASALLVAATVIPKRLSESKETGNGIPFGARARQGTTLFFTSNALRPILTLNLAVAAAGAFVLVQTVVIAKANFDGTDGTVALLLAVNGTGSILGALVLPRLLERHAERTIMTLGLILLSVAIAIVPVALTFTNTTSGILSIGALWLAIGLGWSMAETPVGRIIRRSVGNKDLAPAFAAQFSLSHACWLLTYPLAGWLGTWSLTGAAGILAVVALTATALTLASWKRNYAPVQPQSSTT